MFDPACEDPFYEIRRHANSQHVQKMKLNVVLGAITEMITERLVGGNDARVVSAVDYFGAIMTALEAADQTHLPELLTLLSMVLPKISTAILRSKFVPIKSAVVNILKTKEHRESTSVVRRVLTCLGALLCEQEASVAAWAATTKLKAFHVLLMHFDDRRPKVRKEAHMVTANLLRRHANATPRCSALASHITDFCVEKLDAATSDNCIAALHVVSFLQNTLTFLPDSHAQRLCEKLITLQSLGHPILSAACLRTVAIVLRGGRGHGGSAAAAAAADEEVDGHDDDEDVGGDDDDEGNRGNVIDDQAMQTAPTVNLSVPFIVQVVNAMLQSPPDASDRTMTAVFTDVISAGVPRIAASADGLEQVSVLLPRTFLALVNYVDSNDAGVQYAACMAMSPLIRSCIDERMVREALSAGESTVPRPPLERVICAVQSLLHFRYQSAWLHALPVVSVLFQHVADQRLVGGVLSTLAELHAMLSSTLEAASPKVITAIEVTVGAAVESLGADGVLATLPLEATAGGDAAAVPQGIAPTRSWLIGVLRNHVRRAPSRIEFFQSHILGLARLCEAASRAPSCSQTEAKQHRMHVVKLWSLFPAFCASAADVAAAFAPIAPLLNRALSDARYPELQIHICRGIQALVAGATSQQPPADPGALAALQSFATKFMPSFFTLIDALPVEASERMVALTDTVAAYASITPPQFLNGLFKKVVRKLLAATTEGGADSGMEMEQQQGDSAGKAVVLCELALALVPTLDEEGVTLLYRVLKPMIRQGGPDATLQKRTYKVLLAICEHHPAFALSSENLQDMTDLLLDSLVTCHVTAKQMRLRCMQQIFASLDVANESHMALIPSCLGEVMLCTKEANNKTRETAYQLLLTMSRARRDHTEFFQMALGGLAATTPHMRSASVLALSRLLFEYSKEPEVVAMQSGLLETVLLLLHERAREVVKSAVGFVRLSVAVMTPEQLEPLLAQVIEGLLNWIGESKNQFRQKVKLIMQKLCRKFGFQKILDLVPDSDKKLVVHIQKMAERQEKKRASKRKQLGRDRKQNFEDIMNSEDSEGDSDGDDDDMDFAMADVDAGQLAGKKRRTHRPQAMVRADAKNGGVIDLLDTSVVQNVVRSDKAHRRAAREEQERLEEAGDFGVAKDGRLIISGAARGRRDDSDAEMSDAAEGRPRSSKGKKRGRSNSDAEAQPAAGAGGGKRHRNARAGSEFKSRKAGGDVRGNNKFEPYAYIPLDPKFLAKKQRKNATERYGIAGKGKMKRGKKGGARR